MKIRKIKNFLHPNTQREWVEVNNSQPHSVNDIFIPFNHILLTPLPSQRNKRSIKKRKSIRVIFFQHFIVSSSFFIVPYFILILVFFSSQLLFLFSHQQYKHLWRKNLIFMTCSSLSLLYSYTIPLLSLFYISILPCNIYRDGGCL